MSNKFIIGIFDDEHKMINAAKDLFQKNIKIYDIYTPFPVHGLDGLLEIKRTKLPIVTFIAGLIGLVIALGFQYWVSVVDWPLNVGGKVFNSFVAFVPVAFEITVLFGALITVAFFLCRSKLIPIFETKIFHPRASQDQFVIALEINDATLDLKKLEMNFHSFGASEVTVKEV